MERIEFTAIEWQNGDVHLAHVIGSMALQLRDHGNTYPEGMTPEAWKAVLTEIGEPLVAYADGFEADRSENAEEARKALRRFADVFTYFWD